MPTEVSPPATPKNEHIFPATQLAELAARWKDMTAQRRHAEAMVLLEEIIKLSTPMFERLAQYENFHHTVDLSVLVQAAREKVARWLLAWDPTRGGPKKFFSYMSVCAKRAFLSELAKVTAYRTKFHSTDDNLEKFLGSDDHEVERHDAVADAQRRVKAIVHRWGNPEEAGAVRFIILGMTEGEAVPPKDALVNGAMYAYGLSPDLAKYFYQWAHFALRDAMLDKISPRFTEQDILRAFAHHDPVVDLLEIIPWEMFKRLCAVMGGARLRIPTLEALGRLHKEYLLRADIDKTDLTPDDVDAVAAKHKRTPRHAAQVYEDMSRVIQPDRLGGEFSLDET